MFTFESPHRGNSNEYTQYTIFQYEKETYPKLSQICSNGIFAKGLKNEFERARVNEPSVFEPLKFYCIFFFFFFFFFFCIFNAYSATCKNKTTTNKKTVEFANNVD